MYIGTYRASYGPVVDNLTIPFKARDADGTVSVTIERSADPTTVGQVADAAGFPVCRATVDFDLDGYDALLGWVQTVGTKTEINSHRVFEIDPLQVFAGLDLPFAFYGLNPVLFDAPYRSDRSRYLDWLAHSFLCVAPTHPMSKQVEAVTGFSWGFTITGGQVEVAPIQILEPSDWTRHLADMADAFPDWSFSDSHRW